MIGAGCRVHTGKPPSGGYGPSEDFHPRDLGNVIVFQSAAGVYEQTNGVMTPAGNGSPVMLQLDQAGAVGPELLTDGGFSSGLTSWTWSASGANTGFLTVSNGVVHAVNNSPYTDTLSLRQNGKLTVGKWYKVDIVFLAGSSGAMYFNGLVNNINVNLQFTVSVGTVSIIARATSADFLLARLSGQACNVYIDSISVKEVTGHHAIAANTTNNRPAYSLGSNGLPVLRFTLDDVLKLPTATGFSRNTPYLWAVAGVDFGTPTQLNTRLLSMSTAILGVARYLLYANSSAGQTALATRRLDSDAEVSSGELISTGRQVLTAIADYGNAAMYLRRNKVQIKSATGLAYGAGNTSDTDSMDAYIGSATVAFDGDLYSLVIGNTALSAANLAKVEDWTAREMGI